MRIEVNQIPIETKWAMATKGLTGALTAHLNAMHSAFGKMNYAKIISQIWKDIGRGSAAEIQSMNMLLDNAKLVAQAGVTMCICSMGPEYEIEEVEASENMTIMKITACPWNNRMTEFGVSHDLLTACDTAFWNEFVQTLNPNVMMKHGKQMHRGDSYCEWIFEMK